MNASSPFLSRPEETAPRNVGRSVSGGSWAARHTGREGGPPCRREVPLCGSDRRLLSRNNDPGGGAGESAVVWVSEVKADLMEQGEGRTPRKQVKRERVSVVVQ